MMIQFLSKVGMSFAVGHVANGQVLGNSSPQEQNETRLPSHGTGTSFLSKTLGAMIAACCLSTPCDAFGMLQGSEQQLSCADNAGPCADLILSNGDDYCLLRLANDEVPPNGDTFWWLDEAGVLFCPGIFYLSEFAAGDNNNLNRLSFPDLEIIHGNLAIQQNNNMRHLNFPNLERIAENLYEDPVVIWSNYDLEEINFQNLQVIAGLGVVQIFGNDNLHRVIVHESPHELLQLWCSQNPTNAAGEPMCVVAPLD